MGDQKNNLIDHYRRLWFFNFHRFEGDNYHLMSDYFAQILISEVEEYMPLEGKKVLDVGGYKGFYCKTINEKRRCDAVNLEPNRVEFVWLNTVMGLAEKTPFYDKEFDLVICRGVLEHLPKDAQQQSVNEIFRVTKTGGLCYIAIPPWYNPHAGHSPNTEHGPHTGSGFKPFHILPFKLAKFLTQLFYGKKIYASSFNEAGIYSITFKRMQKMILESGFKLITTKDVLLRLHFLTKIPLIREIAVPTVIFILLKE